MGGAHEGFAEKAGHGQPNVGKLRLFIRVCMRGERDEKEDEKGDEDEEDGEDDKDDDVYR